MEQLSQHVTEILMALILTGIVWIVRMSSDNRTDLEVLKNSLISLDNTVTKEIDHMRREYDALSGRVEKATAAWNGSNRRSGNDRREHD